MSFFYCVLLALNESLPSMMVPFLLRFKAKSVFPTPVLEILALLDELAWTSKESAPLRLMQPLIFEFTSYILILS